MKTVSLEDARRMALQQGASLEVGGRVFNAGQRRHAIVQTRPTPPAAQAPAVPAAQPSPATDPSATLADAIRQVFKDVLSEMRPPEPVPAVVLPMPLAERPLEPAPEPGPSLALAARARLVAKPPRARHRYHMSVERDDSKITEISVTRDGVPAYVIQRSGSGWVVSRIEAPERAYRVEPAVDNATGLVTAVSITPVGPDAAAFQ